MVSSLENSSIRPIHGTLKDATTLDQSGHGSNGNKGVLHIYQRSKSKASRSDGLVSNPGHSLDEEGVLPLCWDIVGIFFSPSQLG